MLRLRTTITLSALLLVLGVAGTGWLTALTSDGYAPSPGFVAGDAGPSAARTHTERSRTASVPRGVALGPRARVWQASSAAVASSDQVMAAPVTAALVPLTTPSDDSVPWAQLRGHLDGQVVLKVSVDGSGRVNAASVAQSSGDELLDAHALRSVWRWRFAVPKDSPDGLSGEVPVRYSSGAGVR